MNGRRLDLVANYAILAVFSVIALFPIVGVALLSLSPPDNPSPGFELPSPLSLDSYKQAWNQGHFGTALRSSLIVATVVVVVTCVLSTLAGCVAYENVSKRFGAVQAVEDLTLRVESGELMVLVGPSGCGKTTSLRMLAGLEAVTSGTLRIGERPVERLAPKARDIATVFQDYALYPQMTVFENLAFGLRLRKMKRPAIAAHVKQAAEALDIGALLDRRPAALSGGQRQRVALGRALVREPQAFLMDEPLSNLDAKLRTRTRGEIKALQRSVRVTTIYVTHDQVEAMTLGDRITVMRGGRVELVGTPSEVYENPANMFVGGFIGSPGMRFGRFEARPGDGVTELVQGTLRLTVPERLSVSGDVVVGVRPEHAGLWMEDAGLLGPLEGAVSYVEALGRETLVGVELGPDFELVVHVAGRCPLNPGDRARIGLRPGCLNVFDSQSERALLRA